MMSAITNIPIWFIALTMLPGILALTRRHHNATAIVALNLISVGAFYLLIATAILGVGLLLLPIPVVGWFVALIWSLTATKRLSHREIDEIARKAMMSALESDAYLTHVPKSTKPTHH
jgi:hypothetical protein